MAGVHGAYIEQYLLAATSTASAFVLIGPAAFYTGVHANRLNLCVKTMC